MIWQVWWAWLLAGVVLGILETILPGFVLLGFALGAVVTGVLLWAGVLGGALAPTLLIFALASLAGWALLRRFFGVRKGQVKIWDRDINEP